MTLPRASTRQVSHPKLLAVTLAVLLAAVAAGGAMAQDAGAPILASPASPLGPLPSLALIESVPQILPVSPVAGGNDPNASNDVLYVLQEDEEDEEEIIENEKGIVRQNGRPVGVRGKTRAHVFVNPSARAAAKYVLSPRVSVEAFVLGGAGAFREDLIGFGTRASNVSGGVSATGNLGLLNAVLAYEHRDAYAGRFATWKSTGDKVGVTVSKTLPVLFLPGLTVTPQLIAARDVVNPQNASASTLRATVGLTYDVGPRLSVAASAGYGGVFLTGIPGFRHDNGLEALVGVTYKPFDPLVLTAGAVTNRTVLYGLPRYRADGSLSPNVNAKLAFLRFFSANLSMSYVRFLSNATGGSTFKYNINPSLNLTVPLPL